MSEFYYCENGLPLPVHPDEVLECLGELNFWDGDPGPRGMDTVARVIAASLSWRERRAAEERQHVKAHERASAETRAILGQIEEEGWATLYRTCPNPKCEESEMRQLGHRVVFDEYGHSVNVGGVIHTGPLTVDHLPPKRPEHCERCGDHYTETGVER